MKHHELYTNCLIRTASWQRDSQRTWFWHSGQRAIHLAAVVSYEASKLAVRWLLDTLTWALLGWVCSPRHRLGLRPTRWRHFWACDRLGTAKVRGNIKERCGHVRYEGNACLSPSVVPQVSLVRLTNRSSIVARYHTVHQYTPMLNV